MSSFSSMPKASTRLLFANLASSNSWREISKRWLQLITSFVISYFIELEMSNAKHNRARAEHSRYVKKLASRAPVDAFVRPVLASSIFFLLYKDFKAIRILANQ